ncbi:response regulator [Thermohalobacter berrensis]|uniref:Response regulatory domain-containing protein n=1 Tax=Thermohalobacter berrensis TaxID=99594 RepID=A0A419T7X2_9FIRM|nr:response regulator [Thermohalobacter berrensis]RKD33523.1 hypothetical protein BET03_09045 [Thermohalobacter berrensis]
MRKQQMMCVDDQIGIRMLMGEIFKDDYEVISASSGKEAVDIAKKVKVDIAILDMNLNDIKGTEVLRQLRNINQNIIGVIITGYRDTEHMKEIRKTNPELIIHKPFDIHKFKRKVKKLMKKSLESKAV